VGVLTHQPPPLPLKTYIKARTSDKRTISFQILIWPNGGVTIEFSEHRPSGWWCIEKGFTTVGLLYDFWVRLGKNLAKQGVSKQAILDQVLELDLNGVEVEP